MDPTDSSTENESDYSLQESDEEFRLSTPSEEEPDFGIPEGPEIVPGVFSPGDFVVVKVYGKKKSTCRIYVSRVLYLEDDGYVGDFTKRPLERGDFVKQMRMRFSFLKMF